MTENGIRHFELQLMTTTPSDYHLSHALIICDGFQFRPSLYCFTEFVDFKNSFCELNLVLVSRKRLGNVIFGTFLVRSLLERGSAAEEGTWFAMQ